MERGDEVWLIDKHAAHERLRFDVLKANRQPLMAQPLLTPETVELEPESYAAVLDNLPLLQEFGFVCEDFGGGTVLIREVPADILAADAAVTLEMAPGQSTGVDSYNVSVAAGILCYDVLRRRTAKK